MLFHFNSLISTQNRTGLRNTALIKVLFYCLLTLLSVTSKAATEANSSLDAPHTSISLLSEYETITPGQSFQVALKITLEPGWHTYWTNPGDTGLPMRINWLLPANSHIEPIQWPYPERIDYEGLINYGYHDTILLPTTISTPKQLITGSIYSIYADLKWLVCKDVCIPVNGSIQLDLNVTDQPSLKSSQWLTTIEKHEDKLPIVLENAQGYFSITDKLTIKLPVIQQLSDLAATFQFFPLQAGLVDNTNKPIILRQDDHIYIQTDIHPDFNRQTTPEDFEGLLVVKKNGNARAFQFNSQPSKTTISFPSHKPVKLAEHNLLIILLLALAGGFILNLMPCVFPILSIKILSLIKSGTHNNRERQLHGLSYTAGILISILAFAGILLSVRAAGESIGWGFQLQSPWFVAILIYVLFLMGLALSGFIELGNSIAQLGNLFENKSGLAGSFFNGILAAVVATPCTAPFMATATGYALTQPVWIALLTFAVLALGLALPFLLIAFIPAFIRLLPKPGLWMQQLKQLLAFPLYLTVIWLLWVLSHQSGSDTLALVMVGMVLLAFAVWLWDQSLYSKKPLLLKTLVCLSIISAISLLPGILPSAIKPDAKINSEKRNSISYSETKLSQAIADNRIVFVNITADWCITCKVNERIALKHSSVQDAFAKNNVLYMVGDWTKEDEILSRLLTRYGRSGVPLYLIYHPGKEQPVILPQLLTPSIVTEALKL